ncbi:hypothetical protein M440DRAFT_1030778 [Trichoderma longibrachiatum ATCC 18648]|uniref:Uncharacterized protein n=1 Tax=Trichoderma longibrachiatum ATCC 18648 TaxID=983965 RepID=A0A2T4BZ80_TRILO|nr:hypothetical protein M440DRAFT_1030778 [Trichoderma longibrachiatum ATCC 18648]
MAQVKDRRRSLASARRQAILSLASEGGNGIQRLSVSPPNHPPRAWEPGLASLRTWSNDPQRQATECIRSTRCRRPRGRRWQRGMSDDDPIVCFVRAYSGYVSGRKGELQQQSKSRPPKIILRLSLMSSASMATLSRQPSTVLYPLAAWASPRNMLPQEQTTKTTRTAANLTMTTSTHSPFSYHSQEACSLSSDYCSTASARGSMSFVVMVPSPGLAAELIRRHLGPAALPSRAFPAYRHAAMLTRGQESIPSPRFVHRTGSFLLRTAAFPPPPTKSHD